MVFCRGCGKSIHETAPTCPHCGATQSGPSGGKEWLTTLLLCIFAGSLGIHRFYTGHILIGILLLLTLGGCGIWALVDLILISTGSYKDSQGRPLIKR